MPQAGTRDNDVHGTTRKHPTGGHIIYYRSRGRLHTTVRRCLAGRILTIHHDHLDPARVDATPPYPVRLVAAGPVPESA